MIQTGNKPKPSSKTIGNKNYSSGRYIGMKTLPTTKKNNHIVNDVSGGITNTSNDKDMIYEPNIKYNSVSNPPTYKEHKPLQITKPKRESEDMKKFV
jgi:hypothetical protein